MNSVVTGGTEFVCLHMEWGFTHVVLVVVSQSELAAREGASIVKESLNELLKPIRTPERTPSPVDACVTEEELFHRKNPKVMFAIGWTAQLK